MVEPRSISVSPVRWLTDSRVYNLIWLGRWLERADNIARVINTFARIAVESGGDMPALQQSLGNAAAIRGIRVEDTGKSLGNAAERARSVLHLPQPAHRSQQRHPRGDGGADPRHLGDGADAGKRRRNAFHAVGSAAAHE